STLPQVWRELPRHLRREPALQRVYADQLRAAGNHREAAALIDAALKQAWTPALVLIYGDLDLDKPTEQLATVERWLKQYGNRNELQLVAGRLCLRNRLWGRARSYLEATLQGPNRAQAQLALGRLFEAIEQPPDALQAYREGLEAAVRP
ncbi:MAG: hypothetical protein L0H83_04640, partial [Salinisphaera sp.]|nr:hypothetical protein [Salinisphaera sp.]